MSKIGNAHFVLFFKTCAEGQRTLSKRTAPRDLIYIHFLEVNDMEKKDPKPDQNDSML